MLLMKLSVAPYLSICLHLEFSRMIFEIIFTDLKAYECTFIAVHSLCFFIFILFYLKLPINLFRIIHLLFLNI